MELSRALLVSIVMFGLLTGGLAHGSYRRSRHSRRRSEPRCVSTAAALDACTVGSTTGSCAWDPCTCTAANTGPGCHLVCTDKAITLCHALVAGANCFDGSATFKCLPKKTTGAQLVCVDVTAA